MTAPPRSPRRRTHSPAASLFTAQAPPSQQSQEKTKPSLHICSFPYSWHHYPFSVQTSVPRITPSSPPPPQPRSLCSPQSPHPWLRCTSLSESCLCLGLILYVSTVCLDSRQSLNRILLPLVLIHHQFFFQNAAKWQRKKLDFESTDDSSTVWGRIHAPELTTQLASASPPHTCSPGNASRGDALPCGCASRCLEKCTPTLPTSAWFSPLKAHQTHHRNLKKTPTKRGGGAGGGFQPRWRHR